jgi:hypothetical protein
MAVFSVYQEAEKLSGTISAVNAAKNPGKGPTSRSTGHIKPTRSDFVADVERAAKKVLNQKQMDCFCVFSMSKKIPETTANMEIFEKVGMEFFRRGIYPLSVYFKDKYVIPERINR